ncbi:MULTISPECIES: energy transducer TonB [unclassified Aureimonas]|uniref:energy transducer TonB family protein n=1 Tax=unclassified Aureimonas TaxID=2615206 RepID=UPI0006F57B94|nr:MULTISPECIES: TonB family protein [unclassified Aureimonas]KQT55155.1 hypothetical protein ASG62_09895 [Aureimonas sp. Leaf427]KQT70944.1 hypothetical protein ASG54_20280 [Aureimonas sp. Leaf460]
MKSGIVVSSGIHLVVLTWGLWAFSSPPPLEVAYSEALPVEIVMAESFQGVKGEKDAPKSEKPAPKPTTKPEKLPMPAQNVGENETDLDTPPTPDKTRNQTPQTGAPKPSARPEAEPAPAKETPKVAEAKPPEPTPPEPKPEPVKDVPKPVPPKETAEKIDPLAEMIAEDKTEPVPEPVKEPAPKKVPTPAVKPKPAEPVKVAEAKPEKPKTETKKPAPKPQKPAKADTSNEDAPDSDMDFEAMAAAAINKQKAAGGGAKRSQEVASLGSKKTTGTTLSRGETDALRDQLSGCWSIPAGIEDGAGLKVSVRFNLNSGGKLDGRPVVDTSSGNRVFDESAVRAVQKCDREGFSLPQDKADVWAEVVVNFDPSEMF